MFRNAWRAAYLFLDVVERIGRVDGEADEDNVRVGVGEGAETVVIFLASGIPEGKLYVLAVHLDIGDVVLENSGDVDLQAACQWMRMRMWMWMWMGRRQWRCCCGWGS
jgi:hypothetical protein